LITREEIARIAEDHLRETNLFVTGVRIGTGNQISVLIDGDEGVKIDDCVKLSRSIESSLDREKEDFSLDVGSHGASSPLGMPRQYRRHIGRDFELKLGDGTRLDGRLTSWEPGAITLEWEEREPKPQGKGKQTVTKSRTVPFSEIREGRIKLKF
jgi:ribosome maturation factor RimP